MMLEHLRRMAHYNAWANTRLLDACAGLDDDEYHKPRKAFFGSIHGTLNHLLVGDRIWFARFEGTESPHERLEEQPWVTFSDVRAAREAEDARIMAFTATLDEDGLARVLEYRSVSMPETWRTPLWQALCHAFNHQTHHRGQVHDMLAQTPVPPPPLDLIYYMREIGELSKTDD